MTWISDFELQISTLRTNKARENDRCRCKMYFKFAIQNCRAAILMCALLFALCASAEEQQVSKLRRIGFLSAGSPSSNPVRYEAFRKALHDLGYVEGKTIFIEYRWAEDKPD